MSFAIVWFRRDLRLADNPALRAAIEAGHDPIPVYIHAPEEDAPWQPGAASQAWLHQSLASLGADLASLGSRLLLRRGSSVGQLRALASDAGASAVYWNRVYEPAALRRDAQVEASLGEAGLEVANFNASLLAEPSSIATLSGEPYKVFTPFWKNLRARLVRGQAEPAPASLATVPNRLQSVTLDSLGLKPRVAWDESFWRDWQPGEGGAHEMLDAFVEGALHGYGEQRNLPDRIGTSRLSAHLHFGEISPSQVISRVQSATMPAVNEQDASRYLGEIGWREFSQHTLFHFPHVARENLSPRFAAFRWTEPDPELLSRWQQGRTGVPLVDAGMRELWQTGWMHNRVRMVVASFLTKNLRYHWLHGARWFWDTLVDADLGNNSQGWQWSAGTGADAAPYFRIFNPVAQAERFDPKGAYIRRWVPELRELPAPAIHAPWKHASLAARLAPDYPATPIVDLAASREDALKAYRDSR